MKPIYTLKAWSEKPWYKWALAGTLLASLGASMSFNPESKLVTRNEFPIHGEISLAETNLPATSGATNPDPNLAKPQQGATTSVAGATPSTPVAKADEKTKQAQPSQKMVVSVDDYTQAVGVIDPTDGKLIFDIEKKSDAKAEGSSYCVDCATKLPIQVIDLKASGYTDLAAIEFFVKAKAQELISKLDKTDRSDSSPSTIDTFDYAIKCDARDFTSGRGKDRMIDFSGFLSCQNDGLSDAITACHDQVDKAFAAKSEKQSKKSSRYSDRYANRNSDREDANKYKICDRFALNYARKSILPNIKGALSSVDGHADGVQAIQDFFGDYGLLADVDGVAQIQNELAQMVSRADAMETLQAMNSGQIDSDLAASGTCSIMANDPQSYSGCMQNARVMAARLNFSNLTYSDYNDLSLDGFSVAAAQIFTTAANSGRSLLVNANTNNFVSALQGYANGSTSQGLINSNGNPVRWAQNAPLFPSSTSTTGAASSAVNIVNGRQAPVQFQPANVNPTAPSPTGANGMPSNLLIPTTAGGGGGSVPHIQ